MKQFLLIAMLLCFTSGLAACDSGTTSTQTDAELIVGSWLATDAGFRTIIPGITVSIFDAIGASDRISIVFGADGSFTSTFDVEPGSTIGIDLVTVALNDATVTGTYTIDDSANRLTLTPGGSPASGDIEYDFNGSNQFELIFEDEELIAQLFGVVGGDIQILMNAISGAEITYQRQ